jgi:membrane associated rhomboid family serine protease
MIPLHDDNPTRHIPVVTIGLITLNVLVFLYELSLPGKEAINAFFASYALTPANLTGSPRLPDYATVATSMFLHGGWMHLIGNMWFLWIFGNNIEDSVGRAKFVFFYLLCGAAAAGAQIAINPSSTTPMVGASGAVSGVLGAYLLLFPSARVLVLIPIWIFWRIFYVPAWLMLVIWFGLQLLSGLAVLGVNLTGGIAFWAHIGGFVAGMVLILPFKKRRVRLFR